MKIGFFYLAGFTVKAQSRADAVKKFIRLGFSALVVEADMIEVERDNPQPAVYMEVST